MVEPNKNVLNCSAVSSLSKRGHGLISVDLRVLDIKRFIRFENNCVSTSYELLTSTTFCLVPAVFRGVDLRLRVG